MAAMSDASLTVTTPPPVAVAAIVAAASPAGSDGEVAPPAAPVANGGAAIVGEIVLVNPSILEHLPDLCCVICQEVLRDPVQTPCLHTFCRQCLLPHIALRGSCPTDRVTLRADEVRSFQDANPGAYRMLFGNLKVHCPLGGGRADSGCQWRGDYTGMTTHMDQHCPLATITCTDCKVSMIRSSLNDHIPVCTHRTITCQYCTVKLPFDELDQHIATICDGAPVVCNTLPETKLSASIPGCGRSVTRSQLAHHQRSECDKSIIKCPLAVHGCGVTCAREALEQHEIDHGRIHTRLLSARLTEITERFARFATMMMTPDGKSMSLPPSVSPSPLSPSAAVSSSMGETKSPVAATVASSSLLPQEHNRLYMIGGVGADRRDTPSCVCFDIRENKWTTMSAMPSSLSYSVAAPFGRTIYSFGGYQTSTGTRLDMARAFSTATRGTTHGVWRALPPLLHARAGHQVVTWNTQHWIIGGNDNDGQATNTCDIFDPATDTVVSGPPMIMARTQHMACVLRGVIYVMGGSATSGNNDLLPASCECYDPKQRKWMPCAPPISRRCGGVAVADESSSQIYVMGGYTPPPAAATDRSAIINNTVEIATPVVMNGSNGSNGNRNDGYVTWSSASFTLPRALVRFAGGLCTTSPSTLLIAGGMDDKGVIQTATYAITLQPHVVTTLLSPLPSPVCSMAFSLLPIAR